MERYKGEQEFRWNKEPDVNAERRSKYWEEMHF